MAELVKESNNSSNIKLFGATISLKQISKPNNNDQEKPEDPTVDKKPDKIIPCPRCKSMETKFCYFNNYNVNQPRHFCKGCQRYWTAGGALRNVPVGAGRRKTKLPFPALSDGCLFDASSVQHELGFGVVEEWRAEEEHGGGGFFIPAKKMRYAATNSKSY
ncbi:hypothetical protein CASFOL_039431 [Castilleja foliolosa]|uniref:Dof-type domain-containing protein n=1 Tax=Castilleja foliolosa TaxID=1961234 RepID=A0ABD3BIC4_9LAMI